MPKLGEKQQKAAESAEGFKLLEPGLYAARLQKVEEKPGNEAPQWSWEFGAIHDEDGNRIPGRQWVNTSLSEKAAWKLREVFEALGYSLDSDTDEMIGEWAVLRVSQGIQQQGKNAGKMQNSVDAVLDFVPEDWPFDPAAIPAPEAAVAAGGGDEF